MGKTELEERTLKFSLQIIGVIADLPKSMEGNVMGRQLLRSGTSIGANYREAGRAESRADFIHKIGIAEKEAAETEYWLELILRSQLPGPPELLDLLDVSREILAILTTIAKSAKAKNQ